MKILNFIPGLKADRSEVAKKFYLALQSEPIPEVAFTKVEFLATLTDSHFKDLATATNFSGIYRVADRIVITFPQDQPFTLPDKTPIESDKPQPGEPIESVDGKIGWFMNKGERVEGPIVKEIMSHDKPYYGIMHNGKLKYKLKSQVNLLN